MSKKNLTHYEVIVGNIGMVYNGKNENDAMKAYDEYVEQSKTGYGRASGESVTLIEDDEILFSFNP